MQPVLSNEVCVVLRKLVAVEIFTDLLMDWYTDARIFSSL